MRLNTTEFVEDYKNTYFKEVYEDTLSKKYKLGRVRIIIKGTKIHFKLAQRSGAKITYTYNILIQDA